jgi:hypothetical protein
MSQVVSSKFRCDARGQANQSINFGTSGCAQVLVPQKIKPKNSHVRALRTLLVAEQIRHGTSINFVICTRAGSGQRTCPKGFVGMFA